MKRRIQSLTLGLSSVLVFACIWLVGSTIVVSAAEPVEGLESITLAPSSNRYQFDAGAVYNDELTVVNDGKTPYTFILYARPYSVTNGSHEPIFEAGPSNADAYEWVQFYQTSWQINPGETIKIPYTISVPANAAPGGHYGVIFAETQPAQSAETAVVRKKRVGSIIYATVNGIYTTGGQVLSSSISSLQFTAPLLATVLVENSGNADFEAETNLQVKDIFGTKKFENSKTSVVLPGKNRLLENEWQNVPWIGLYNVRLETKFLDQVSVKENFVLVTPKWVLLVLAGILVGGGVYAAHRRNSR